MKRTDVEIQVALIATVKDLPIVARKNFQRDLQILFDRSVKQTLRAEACKSVLTFLVTKPVSKIEELLLAVGFFDSPHLQVWNLDLVDTGLPQRVITVLNSANIFYVGELVRKTAEELRNISGFGVSAAIAVNSFLNTGSKLELGTDTKDWISPDPTRSF